MAREGREPSIRQGECEYTPSLTRIHITLNQLLDKIFYSFLTFPFIGVHCVHG